MFWIVGQYQIIKQYISIQHIYSVSIYIECFQKASGEGLQGEHLNLYHMFPQLFQQLFNVSAIVSTIVQFFCNCFNNCSNVSAIVSTIVQMFLQLFQQLLKFCRILSTIVQMFLQLFKQQFKFSASDSTIVQTFLALFDFSSKDLNNCCSSCHRCFPITNMPKPAIFNHGVQKYANLCDLVSLANIKRWLNQP